MIPIEYEEYEEAVLLLTGVAQTDTSGGRVAAQVVLSAYNGSEWQLDVTELSLLDGEYYQAALNVIRGRKEIMVEPHDLISNGQEIFYLIRDRWQQYHISNRWKQTCSTCNGLGDIVEYDDYDRETRTPCHKCNSTGLIV